MGAFGHLLGDSIRLRLRSDVPVGSSLSGGLDSSAIVGYLAAACEIEHQHAFSARFPGSPLDEGRYIADVVRLTGAQSHEVVPEPSAADLCRTVWHQDQPFLSLSIYAQWSVMRLRASPTSPCCSTAREPTRCSPATTFSWDRISATCSSARAGCGSPASCAAMPHAMGFVASRRSAYYALPPNVCAPRKRFVRRPGIAAEFVKRHGGLQPPLGHVFDDPLRDALHATLSTTMLPSLLRHADRNSMAFGREVRLPFLDHRLVELAFSLPADLKLSGATTKVVLREAMAAYLPASVRGRLDKVGYAPPQVAWLRGPLRELADDTFASESLAGRPWADAAWLRATWRSFLAGERRQEGDLVRALSLELWARAFLDAATFPPDDRRRRRFGSACWSTTSSPTTHEWRRRRVR